MINVLYVGPVSCCLELENDLPYRPGLTYRAFLNGAEAGTFDTNVFSLYRLTPDTEYTVTLPETGDEVTFRTAAETCCVNVRDFGAAGDGRTDDSSALQCAVACMPAGGRLFFPAGTYLTGPLFLKSGITLDLSDGAVLLAVPDRNRFPVLPGSSRDPRTGAETVWSAWEGSVVPARQAFVCGEYVRDVAVIGGVLDGNGRAGGWWTDVKHMPVARPRLVFLNHCENIVFHGVTGRNSPAWNFHPFYSKGIGFYDLFVTAPDDSPNTDAVDPESCDGVDIIGCRFSVGDDCIAIKAGKIDLARAHPQPADHHTIRNCLMESGHGAVTLGSELSSGIRHLTVNRCVFSSTDRGLRVKSRRGRGKDAVIDGVVFENIRMTDVKTPIVINLWYNCCDPDRHSEYVHTREALPVDDRTPRLGAFTFRRMTCERCHVAACYIDGLPEMPIGSVTLEDLSFTYAPDAQPGLPAMRDFMTPFCKAGLYVDNVRRLTVSRVSVSGQEGRALTAMHVEQIDGDCHDLREA